MAFVSVPAAEFEKAFAAKFKKVVVNREVVYEIANHLESGLRVRVYTSLSEGGAECREVGSDAIRACLVYTRGTKTWGIAKAKRVNRTGNPADVVARAVERAREMYALANKFAASKCSCGSPRWLDSGRCVARCG